MAAKYGDKWRTEVNIAAWVTRTTSPDHESPFLLFFFQPVQQWLWGKHHWEATGIHNTFLLFSFKPHKINMSEVLKFVYKLILVVRVTNILAAPLEKSSNTNLVKTGQNQQVIFSHNTVPLLRAETQFSPLHAYRPQISLQTIPHSKNRK